jgi:signal transduction histidine kinase
MADEWGKVLHFDDPRAAESTAVTRASWAVAACDEGGLADAIVGATAQALEVDDVSVMVLEGDHLRVVSALGPRALARRNAEVRLGEGLAGTAALERRAILVDDGEREGARSSIVCPLLLGSRLLGVVNMSRRRPAPRFRDEDVERVRVLASLLALALEHQRMAVQLAERVRELETARRAVTESARMTAIGQMSAALAHELATPLAYVSINVQHVRGELIAQSGDPELVEALDEVGGGLSRIRETVRDLSTLARDQDGGPQEYDAGEMVRFAARVAQAQLRALCDLELVVMPNLVTRGRPGRLSQALLGLLLGAGRAVAATGRRGHVRVRGERVGNQIVLTIADDGVGMTDEVREHAFDALFATKDGAGAGIGLPMAREVVEKHGGTVDVQSVSREGTTVTIRLPVALSDGEGSAP